MADCKSCLFDNRPHNITVTSDRYLHITDAIASDDAD